MARTASSDSATQDSIASYMDGVQVKIAEAYKPPRKIALPAFYNNKLPDVTKYDYDFNYEITVLEKISELRKVRSTIRKSKKQLEEEKQKEEEKEEKEKSERPKTVINPEEIRNSDMTTILTPQPLSPLSSQIEDIKINGLDYSDFDNDTSSPFDNMELKTINDMEELAQVLQPASTWNVSANPVEPTTIEKTTENNEEENRNVEEEIFNKKKSIKEDMENNKHIVCSIVQELQKLLENACVKVPEREEYTPPVSPKENPKKCFELENSLSELSEEDQNLAKHLNDMGFPLSRSARAIQALGGQDNEKIVEYLLALQYLEDAGFEEQTAAKALVLTQFDEHKAKKYCENLITLKNFGFSEDEASEALIKCDVDRDKALDLLIT